jgi:hypothetical protein
VTAQPWTQNSLRWSITLAPKLERLLAMLPLAYGALSRDMPNTGVYLFTEAGRHLYVGRSNGLRKRHGRDNVQNLSHFQD